MEVKIFPHQQFTSNTYLIEKASHVDAFFVDIGEYEASRKYVQEKGLQIQAVFLTHGHYDHIYGIRHLLEDFPQCSIYGHGYTLQSLLDPKLNLSFYHDDPVFLTSHQGIAIAENFEYELYTGLKIQANHTPGHNPGSMCYVYENKLFTGDSYIPFIPVVTKLKGGNKEENIQSLKRIKSWIQDETEILAGHKQTYLGKEVLNQDELLDL